MSKRAELERLVLAALGEPCEECARVISVMLASMNGGEPKTLDDLARRCGFPARWALARHLGTHGLPPPRPLKNWLCFLAVRHSWDIDRRPLQRQAVQMGVEPSVLHRLVKRLTGGTWDEAKQLELADWVGRFQSATGAPTRCDGRGSGKHE